MDNNKKKDVNIQGLLKEVLDSRLKKIICSNPRKKSAELRKVTVKPVLIKGNLQFQFEYLTENKATHKNMDGKEAALCIADLVAGSFKQINIFTAAEEITVLASKPEKLHIKRRTNPDKEFNNQTETANNSAASNSKAPNSPDANSPDANSQGANLPDANSQGANLSDGNLSGTNLPGADSSGSEVAFGLSQKAGESLLAHDRKKKYIIPEDVPCDFLIRLGVMDENGKVFKKHYSKFRQINRYLEILNDVVDKSFIGRNIKNQNDVNSASSVNIKNHDIYIADNQTATNQKNNDSDKKARIKIIDFGCGKAYLTFAVYYYLHVMKGMNLEVVGLDLKKDVIEFCNNIADDLGYENLVFKVGDIADYKDEGCDMVMTLHACDTATDFALANAVAWDAKVILSVPCCQHELFKQIKNEELKPLLKHGILKDRFTELLTDSLRGLALESRGYDVQMIEFTTLEHTQKNIMIRAIKANCPEDKKSKKAAEKYYDLKNQFGARPTTDLILPSAASAAAEAASN